MIANTLLIADREIRERRFVFIAAAVAAVLPYLTALIPGTKLTRSDVSIVALVVSILFAVALAFIVGGSIVGRDLAEKRLSFYFTRPLPAPAIWFGKLLAAIALVVVSFGMIAGPAVLLSGLPLPTATAYDRAVVAGWFVLLLGCILLGHVVSTMVRSRSPRVVVDLVLVAIAFTIGVRIVRPLVASFAVETAGWLVTSILAGAMVAALAGGAWQLSRGRSDARRSHAALQTFLWPAIGILLLLAAGFVAWLFSAKPSDLVYPDIGQISQRWLSMGGKARNRGDYRPLFLVNGENGRAIRIPVLGGWSGVSRDGSTVAYATTSSFNPMKGPFALQVMNVIDGSTIDTALSVGPTQRRVLSDDGRQIAVIGDGVVSVHDIREGRLVASARLPRPATPEFRYRLVFVSPSALRLYEEPTRSDRPRLATIRALEFDLAARRIAVTGELARDGEAWFLQANDDASRLLVLDARASRVTLVDGRTLQIIAELDARIGPYLSILFLRDGSVAVIEQGDQGRFLSVFSPSGARVSKSETPARYLVGEAPGAGLIAGLSQRLPDGRHDPTTLVIDAADGRVLRREEHVSVVRHDGGRWVEDPRQPLFTSDKLWILQDKSAVWRWDPRTGAKTALVRTQTPAS